MKLDVPFIKQVDKTACVPTSVLMALKYFSVPASLEEIYELCEYVPDTATFIIQAALAVHEKGMNCQFYSQYPRFNDQNMDLSYYQSQARITGEKVNSLVDKAQSLHIPVITKHFELDELLALVNANQLVMLILNWSDVLDKPERGFVGHFVIITGYDDEYVYVHNHGFLDPRPYFEIPRDVFDKARTAKGTDEDVLVISRL